MDYRKKKTTNVNSSFWKNHYNEQYNQSKPAELCYWGGWPIFAVHGFNREIKAKYVRILKYYVHELKSAPTGTQNHFGCSVIQINLQM